MELIVISGVLLFFMVALSVINKKLASSSTGKVLVNYLGDKNYIKRAIVGKEKTSGEVPNLFYFYFIIFVVTKGIKRKIKKGEKLESVEKAFIQSASSIKDDIKVKRKNFANLLYVNGFCRVILIAKSILLTSNYMLNDKNIKKYLDDFKVDLTVGELKNLPCAFNYQLVIEFGKVAKYILYLNAMKKKAKKGGKNLFFSSTYTYYFGKYTSDFELFEKMIKPYYDDYYIAVSKHLKTNSYYLNKTLSIVQVSKFLKSFYPLKLSKSFGILQNNVNFANYQPSIQLEVLEKIEEIAIGQNQSEEKVCEATLTLCEKNRTEPYMLLFKNNDLVSKVLNSKKKRKTA